MEPFFESFDSLFDKPQDNTPPPIPNIDNQPQYIKDLSENSSYYKPLPDLSKLKQISSYKKNLVLLLYGSFYPIHNNHLGTLKIAKDFIESSPDLSKTYHIMGSFIMPTHLNSLKKKLGKPLLDNQIRLEFCEKAIEDSEWISVLPFLSHQEKKPKNQCGFSSR